MDEANGAKQGSVGRLQQMSDDMKLHIAQLKAELGNADIERHGMKELEKEFRNKAVAKTLRKKMELAKHATEHEPTSVELSQHCSNDEETMIHSNPDVVESLSNVITEVPSLTSAYVPVDEDKPCKNSIETVDCGDSATSRQLPSINHKLKQIHDTNTQAGTEMCDTDRPPDLEAAGNPHDERVDARLPQSSVTSQLHKPHLHKNLPSTSTENKNHRVRTGRSRTRIVSTYKKRKSKSCQNDLNSTDSSQSSPRSLNETTEDSIPVKYLQMSSNSPRLMKKTRSTSLKKKPSSAPPISRQNKTSKDSSNEASTSLQVQGSKYDELEAKLQQLQFQCEVLAEENIKIKKEHRSKAEERIASLKRRNGELANIARHLEEKARSLQEQNSKKTQELAATTRDLQQQKRAHQRHRARWETEQARSMAECNDQLVSTRGQVDDLKRALRQARREKLIKKNDNDSGDKPDVIKQNQKEILRLQKLAAAASAKIVVRSLSTPVTARQKILEESNRNLRRQITVLENNLQEAETKLRENEKIHETLTTAHDEKNNLKKEIEELRRSVTILESELQESKVETSDVSVQLTNLKHIHVQLQNDYSTVHEQLSVAINERDQAIRQCIDNAGKLNEMDAMIKNLQGKEDTYHLLQKNHQEAAEIHTKEVNNLVNSHEKIVADYQEALFTLQSKVKQLEQQCHDHDVTNKNMKEQLSVLVEWSKTTNIANPSPPVDNKNNNNIRGASHSSVECKSPIMQSDLEHRRLQPQGHRSASPSGRICSASSGLQHSKSANLHNNVVMETDDTEAEDFDEEVLPQGGAMHPVDGVVNTITPSLQVYIAKYTYNPFEGPNEHPESELPLVAGDYVYVYGNIDEDGFYEGELMNGRHGLVPSNFLEPVHDAPPSGGGRVSCDASIESSAPAVEELYKPRRSTSREGSIKSVSKCRSMESEMNRSFCSSVTASSLTSHADSYERYTARSGGENRMQNVSVLPYPRKLRVDKKLSHSLIIGWVAPQLDEDDIVEEYHVLVDGHLATVVNGNKSKAVVENIFHEKKTYMISVCAVTEHGHSEPGHCVLCHGGQGSYAKIDGLRAEHVTTRSARVSWEPMNSNFTHSISIGEVPVEALHNESLTHYQRQIIVPSPMFRHTINGLLSNTLYEIVVKSRSSKLESEASSEILRFTTPSMGPPDPPFSVQIEDNFTSNSEFIIVTWLPVTINERGNSNDIIVTGYTVHINGVIFTTVEPSTSDQCQISMKALSEHVQKILEGDPSYRHRSDSRHSNTSSMHSSLFSHYLPSVKLTVRTVGVNGQVSDDSNPFHLHKSLINQLIQANEQSSSNDDSKSLRNKSSNAFTSDKLEPRNDNDDSLPPAVPSIEITQETSSEEEVHERFLKRINSGQNTPSTVRQVNGKHLKGGTSPHQSRTVNGGNEIKKLFEQNTSDKVRSRSTNRASTLDSSHRRNNIQQYTRRRAHSDEESGTSASSGGHTSTSTSGSLKQNHKTHLRSNHNWVEVQPQVARKDRPSSSLNDRLLKHDKQSNSSHSVRSDDHANGGLWISAEKDSRNVMVARQHRRSNNTTSSQSGRESLSEFDSIDDSRVFLFVALYDYNPYTMSPNAECLDEELSFSEGQLIKVYGEKDSDGFYIGENQQGKRGYIPCNMVSSVQVEDFTMLEELFEHGHLPSTSPQDNIISANNSEQLSDQQLTESHSPIPVVEAQHQPILFVALFDYDPKESSPNIDAEVELSFSRGDLINVYGPMDEDGFFRGEINGQFGLVPSNFLEEVSDNQLQVIRQLNQSGKNSVSKVSTTTMTDPKMTSKPKIGSNSTQPHPNDPASVASTSSNASSYKSEGNKRKGIFSKGKKLLKKLGGNETKARR